MKIDENCPIQARQFEQIKHVIHVNAQRADHVFNSNRLTCKCLWCGRKRDGFDCPVTIKMREEIEDFVKEHGPQWKIKLSRMWMEGHSTLYEIRNILGPSGVYKISRKLLKS